jgi:hypothetical protein
MRYVIHYKSDMPTPDGSACSRVSVSLRLWKRSVSQAVGVPKDCL